MLAADIQLMAEKDLLPVPRLVAVLRLDELTDHRPFQLAYQVGKKHEPILQHSEHVQRLPTIVIRNMPRHLPYPLLNLLRGNDDFQFRFSHKATSRTHSPCPFFACKSRRTPSPRTHTTSSPQTPTGHSFFSSPVMCRSCNS